VSALATHRLRCFNQAMIDLAQIHFGIPRKEWHSDNRQRHHRCPDTVCRADNQPGKWNQRDH